MKKNEKRATEIMIEMAKRLRENLDSQQLFSIPPSPPEVYEKSLRFDKWFAPIEKYIEGRLSEKPCA